LTQAAADRAFQVSTGPDAVALPPAARLRLWASILPVSHLAAPWGVAGVGVEAPVRGRGGEA
jgi:hypothetical protein